MTISEKGSFTLLILILLEYKRFQKQWGSSFLSDQRIFPLGMQRTI